MKILVTGHRGMLGGACVKAFRSHGYDVVTPENEDLRNRNYVYWVFNRLHPEGVIHCAAKVGGVKANRDQPVDFIEDNLAINSNVIGASHAFDVKKLVNIGTSCLYPKNAPVPVKESSLLTGPFEPDVSAYATAKLVAHASCNAYRTQYGRDYITVCPCNLYGDNDNYGPSAHVLPALIRKAYLASFTNDPLAVWGDGTATRELLRADDAAEAIVVAFEKWSSSELINIGSGIGTSIKELAEMVASYFKVSGIKWEPSEPTGIHHKTFDVTRIESLGWKQRIPLSNGIPATCSDYLMRLQNNTIRKS